MKDAREDRPKTNKTLDVVFLLRAIIRNSTELVISASAPKQQMFIFEQHRPLGTAGVMTVVHNNQRRK